MQKKPKTDLIKDLIDEAKNFADEGASEIAKYKPNFVLSQECMTKNEYIVRTLSWDSVSYGVMEEIDRIPDDKRGVYAFAVCRQNEVLPPHGYVLYIGIAGRNSTRSLRQRYKDYLKKSYIRRRPKINRMIGTWYEILKFFFAPVEEDVSSDDLKTLESQLNTALLPPFSVNDLKAEVRRKRRAFI